MKYGNLNFLEPSGPLQACNGTALLFFLITRTKRIPTYREQKGESSLQRKIQNYNYVEHLNRAFLSRLM